MKQFWKEFCLRGLICASGGPLVLAVIYGIFSLIEPNTPITAAEASLAIITITALAFIAAGMTAIYQMEQLPLATMILLHGGALYLAYILVYLINGWLMAQIVPVLVFTGIFIVCYALIWLVIYTTTKMKTNKLNKMLKS